jgi:DNA polymerase-3 subunit beta
MVATDSFRLAIIEQISEIAFAEPFEALIPGKALEEVARMATGSESITIAITQSQALFTFGETSFITRKLEGKFPNYQHLIPSSYATKSTTNHE